MELLFGKLDKVVGEAGSLNFVRVELGGFFPVCFFYFRIGCFVRYTQKFVAIVKR